MLGVDVGQRHEASGLCVVECTTRRFWEKSIDHFVVRHLERIEPGTLFPGIAFRVRAVVRTLAQRTEDSPLIYVDATDLGEPIVTMIRDHVESGTVYQVNLNPGDQRTKEGTKIHLGKSFLVTRLQILLQAGQLHLPRTALAQELAEDLVNFQIRAEPDANQKYAVFRVGRHDELVTALGLAVQTAPARWGLT